MYYDCRDVACCCAAVDNDSHVTTFSRQLPASRSYDNSQQLCQSRPFVVPRKRHTKTQQRRPSLLAKVCTVMCIMISVLLNYDYMWITVSGFPSLLSVLTSFVTLLSLYL